MNKRIERAKPLETNDGLMECWQAKMNQYSDMLYKIAFLQLKNCQDAEDVVQETLYQYIKCRQEFECEEHERAWLVKVTLNGCRKIWRSAWYRRTEAMPRQDLPGGGNLEKDALRQEEKRQVVDAVMGLPRKYREVIHLFYFQEMSVKEISMATRRKESTITSQLTRGREILKKKLKEVYQYE